MRWHSVPFPGRGDVTFGDVAVRGSRAWALGYSGHQVVIERWRGSSWQRMPAPKLGSYEYLNAITASGPRDVWVVGTRAYAIESGGVPIALHWDGQSWTRFRVPRAIDEGPGLGGGGGELLDVTAVSPGNVWAAGRGNGFEDENDEGLVVHWNGQQWHRSPWDADVQEGISVGANGDVWIAGWDNKEVAQPSAAVFRHGSWLPLEVENPYIASFADINAEGPSVWVVGNLRTPGTDGALIERWDGEQFRMLPVEGAERLSSVTQFGSQAFAVGMTDTRAPVIERWRNDHWSPVHIPAGWATRTLGSIEAGPDGSVWAVGSFIARSCIDGR